MIDEYRSVLDRLTQVSGVRGAMYVNAEDGVVIADALMPGVRGNALAALAASLTRRAGIVVDTVAAGPMRFLQLQGDDGLLVTVPAADGVLIVVVGGEDMNVGLVRLEMFRAVEGAS